MQLSVIQTGLIGWIETITGLQAIQMDQNGPKPPNSYFGLRISSIVTVGRDYIAPPNSSGESEITGNDEFTAEIYGFGDDTLNQTQILRKSLDMPKYQELLRESQIVIIEALPILNISDLSDTRYEERTSMDVRFRSWTEQTDDSIGLIETINAEGTYKSPDKPDITQNISVTKP